MCVRLCVLYACNSRLNMKDTYNTTQNPCTLFNPQVNLYINFAVFLNIPPPFKDRNVTGIGRGQTWGKPNFFFFFWNRKPVLLPTCWMMVGAAFLLRFFRCMSLKLGSREIFQWIRFRLWFVITLLCRWGRNEAPSVWHIHPRTPTT
jgi:hypothetical protein